MWRVFFFFLPLRFEMVVQSSQVLQLHFFPHSCSFQRFTGNCRTPQEEKTKQNVTPWSFRLTIELSENSWALPARNKERAGHQQPAPAGCHLKSEIKRRFSCTVGTDEINEAESVWVSFPFETQISVAASLISPQCLRGKGSAARWFSWLMESRGCQKEHLDSRHIICNIIIHGIHSTPHCPGQTLAFLLNFFVIFILKLVPSAGVRFKWFAFLGPSIQDFIVQLLHLFAFCVFLKQGKNRSKPGTDNVVDEGLKTLEFNKEKEKIKDFSGRQCDAVKEAWKGIKGKWNCSAAACAGIQGVSSWLRRRSVSELIVPFSAQPDSCVLQIESKIQFLDHLLAENNMGKKKTGTLTTIPWAYFQYCAAPQRFLHLWVCCEHCNNLNHPENQQWFFFKTWLCLLKMSLSFKK